MITVNIFQETGEFAENKDVAKELRDNKILPALASGKQVTLDFSKVRISTQSFIHALISEAIRVHGIDVLDQLLFKNCTETVKILINTVVDYMQAEPPDETEQAK
jgi:hypothetical protein